MNHPVHKNQQKKGLPQNVRFQQDVVYGLQTSADILYGKFILRQPLLCSNP